MEKTLKVWSWTLAVFNVLVFMAMDFSEITNGGYLIGLLFSLLYPIFVLHTIYRKK